MLFYTIFSSCNLRFKQTCYKANYERINGYKEKQIMDSQKVISYISHNDYFDIERVTL